MLVELENLEEIREEASIKEEKYKRMIEKYYNSKVKEKNLRKGDLIWY